MTRLLLVAHAPLASSLQTVARHAFADCAGLLQALDVASDEQPAAIEERLRALLEPGADTLILADVFGATPCNAALRVADGRHVRVVAGLSVPMLWRTLCYAAEPLEALVVRAVDGGRQGVIQGATARPQNQSSRVAADDQVQHQHQQ